MTLAMLAKYATATIFGIFFINVGIAHFTDTQWFEPIVPKVLGDPTKWVLLTGVIEIALGVGLILPQSRRYCSIITVLFLLAIYWANYNMWVNDIPLDGHTFATVWHVLRFLAQLLMILIALWIGGWLLPMSKSESQM